MSEIFLMCSERSGSNLITKIFDAHPDVCGPSPSHLAQIMVPNLWKYGNLKQSWQQLTQDTLELFQLKNSAWRLTLDNKMIADFAEPGDFPSLLSAIYKQERELHGKQHILLKENQIYSYASYIRRYFPDAKYLYMMRDPRDMASSWKQGFAIRGGVVRAARTWKQDQHGYTAMRHEIGADKVPCFSYESLLQQPQQTLQHACALLGIDFHPDMLNFHQKQETQSSSSVAIDWRNIGNPLMQNNFNTFEKRLTQDEIKFIEYLCWDEMASLGYNPIYDRLNDSDFIELEAQLSAVEPYEKPEFMTIPQAERERRGKLHRKITEIRNKPHFIEDKK
ncbi:sulfotransferase [Neiella sp. HB171785]|uniref:Sulfotransferase n=1 Tax=Neiella litorisoli TaxID=2771431 RepID=A0A8J6QIP0_9GAMM|nr:sulfotransferase [Neiella litorisoli]